MLAEEFAGILNKKDDSAKYAGLAKNIKDRIVAKYLVPNTGRFDNATQAAQLFALWYNLSPEKNKPCKFYSRFKDITSIYQQVFLVR
jgi:alpha-L-rhamnosidase